MDSKTIVIVSGLPRSGTSMMMKMLEAGGQTILTDNLREPDANNPKGYYEFERVKQLKDGDVDWLSDALGKTIKIVTGLITYLPSRYNYKVIFMQRDLHEILASQKKMLSRLGKEDDNIPDDKMEKIYQEHLKQVKAWLVRQPNIEVLNVNYNTMIATPHELLTKVNIFLGTSMDVQTMASIVDAELYRERKK